MTLCEIESRELELSFKESGDIAWLAKATSEKKLKMWQPKRQGIERICST